MRIATFNCNSVRVRLPIVLDWLRANRPDALALQETRVPDSGFPEAAFRDEGWQVAFRGEKRQNGVALVSRAAPDEVSFGMDDGDGGVSASRLACARYGRTWVVNTYVPQGQTLDSPAFAFKRQWLGRLRAWFARRFDPARDEVAWVGDLNIAPDPADVHSHQRIWPHVCHCQEMTGAFRNLLGWGLVDIVRRFLPGAGVYTFWDYRQAGSLAKDQGWRIDHILATAPLAARAESARVDRAPRALERPSDHTVVVACFREARKHNLETCL